MADKMKEWEKAWGEWIIETADGKVNSVDFKAGWDAAVRDISQFLKEEEEELANFIDIPLFARGSNVDPKPNFNAHRLLKIEDSDTVVFLESTLITTGTDVSLEQRDDVATD